MIDTFIFDVDGTLVETNYQHALSWYRAFRRFDLSPAIWRIHRAVGMGGDQLVEAVTGKDVEDQYGDQLRSAWTEEFDEFLPEVQPFEGAEELLADVRRRGLRLVLASSGQSKHVDRYLELLNGRELAEAWTTSDDVEETKPAPDLVKAAMGKVDGVSAIMVGDSPWDAEAATRAGVPTVAVRTGGFSVQELLDGGAARVYESLEELQDDLDNILSLKA